MKTRNFIFGFFSSLLLVAIILASGYFFLKKQRAEMLLEENTKEVTELKYTIINLETSDLEKLNLKDINNKSISFDENEFIFINFWATWCMPCVAEMPSINNLINESKRQNLKVRFVFATDDKLQKVLDFEEKKQYGFEYVFFLKNELPKTFINNLIPSTYFIDKENMLCYKIEGTANYDSKVFKKFIKSITMK